MVNDLSDKIVQTELSPSEYKKLKEVTKRNKITLKDALREAVNEWVRLQTPLEEDPLFSLTPIDTGIESDSSDHDTELYGKPQ